MCPEIFLDERKRLNEDAERRRHEETIIELDRQQHKVMLVKHDTIFVDFFDQATKSDTHVQALNDYSRLCSYLVHKGADIGQLVNYSSNCDSIVINYNSASRPSRKLIAVDE